MSHLRSGLSDGLMWRRNGMLDTSVGLQRQSDGRRRVLSGRLFLKALPTRGRQRPPIKLSEVEWVKERLAFVIAPQVRQDLQGHRLPASIDATAIKIRVGALISALTPHHCHWQY